MKKLSQENTFLKQKLKSAQNQVKNTEKQLLTHQKSTKQLEINISKKLEFTEGLKKSYEQLQAQYQKAKAQNGQLRDQIQEAKRVLTEIQLSAEEKVKETLKKNYLEWKNQEKLKILKIKQSVDKEVEDRLNLEKEVIFQKFKTKMNGVKTLFEKKEADMKVYYENELVSQKKNLISKFKTYMES